MRFIAPKSLRSRWNRAFAALVAVVVVGGTANLAATRILVIGFQDAAAQTATDGALLARLRADILPHTVQLVRSISAEKAMGPDLNLAHALEASIRRGFRTGIAESRTPAQRQSLQDASDRWESMVAAVGPLDQPAPVTQRGPAIAFGLPEVSRLLDVATSASRAAADAELERAAWAGRMGTLTLAALLLVVTWLTVRLARQLSVEVLRPVAMLRNSANQLAAGDLDHRVESDRADELGDLAASFNAMARAIAGSQRSLSLQANHDSLTGLANRAAFRARLESAVAQTDRRAGTQAVLFVDLDDFKDVNDTLGHAAGDELLVVVADRLRDAVRPSDLVARLGGDEFAVLLDGVPDAAVAHAVAERAVAALAAPAEVLGTMVHVGVSIGLTMSGPGSDPESLMREADVAMYLAKSRGKNRVEHYDAVLHDAVVDRNALKAEVTGAPGRGELVLDYQPIVDLASGTWVGMEALVRWQHPTRGLLPPSAFIEVAEQTGAIVDIGTWVLRTAAQQLQTWRLRYDLPALWLAVNVSVGQLAEPGFAALVGDTLLRTGLDPTSLVIEVTESVLADPAGGAPESLATLRQIGVRVALDDFGTGYSSIRYLQQLPVDILKIDRSFVSGEAANRPGDVLLDAIVGLAQRLGLEVIPEGIEDAGQLARLQAMGCRTGQGFHLARPVPPAAIEQRLESPPPISERMLRHAGASVPR